MKKYVVIFIVLALFLIAGTWVLLQRCEEEKETVVELESIVFKLNPEVLLVIDEDEKIVFFEGLNDEANIAFSDENFIGKDLMLVIDQMLDISYELAYLDEFSENINIDLETEEWQDQLKERIKARIEANLERRSISARVNFDNVDQELIDEADELGIRVAKLIVINKALAIDDSLEKEDLLDLTIREIMQLVSEETSKMRQEIRTRFNEETMEMIRTRFREEAQQIREMIEANFEEFKEMTGEEKREFIEEHRNQMLDAIRERVEELQDEYGEEVINNRGRIFNQLNSNLKSISDEVANIRQEIINQMSDYDSLTPMDKREIFVEIQMKVREYFASSNRENIEIFRENLINQIINTW